jgi:hypothetical protein
MKEKFAVTVTNKLNLEKCGLTFNLLNLCNGFAQLCFWNSPFKD